MNLPLRVLVGLLLGLTLTLSAAQAQPKPRPKFGPPITYKSDPAEAPVAHGTQLRVTMKNTETYYGTCVLDDPVGSRLLLRTRPGLQPMSLPYGEIGTINPIKAAKPANGGVIPAVFQPGAPPGPGIEVQPEIHVVTITQGDLQTLEFRDLSGALSPSEREGLFVFQNAYNDVAKLENLLTLARQMLETEAVAQQVRLQMAQRFNEIIRDQPAIGEIPPALNQPLWQFWDGPGFFGSGWYGPGAFWKLPTERISLADVRVSPDPTPRELFQTISAALPAARQRLLAAQNIPIYEGGRVIAVSMPEPKK